MAKVSVLTTLLLQLLRMLMEVSGESPCPQYFIYSYDPATNEIMGQIQIPLAPKDVELRLKVNLSMPLSLPTRYVGQLELTQSEDDSIQTVLRGEPLLYHIHFPLKQPIPVLTSMWFNDHVYCTGQRAVGPIVTTIVLEHTLYPPRMMLSSNNTSSNFGPPQEAYRPEFITSEMQTMQPFVTTTELNHRPTESKLITPRPTTKSLSDKLIDNIPLNSNNPLQFQSRSFLNDNECGRNIMPSSQPVINYSLDKQIITSPREWSWFVALFHGTIRKVEFQCVGSLITNRHILTVAQCFMNIEGTIPANSMLAYLGHNWEYDSKRIGEGSLYREIASYAIHPDYRISDTGDSDLAVVVLRISVEYSPTLRPICLWTDPSDLQDVVGKMGYLPTVRWKSSYYNKPDLSELQIVKMPIVSQDECRGSNPNFARMTSNRTFCAGLRDGSGPCNGDGGSGLALYDLATGRFKLRGIVSRSVFDRVELTCDLKQYVVFVDVAKYMSWIHEKITHI